MKHQPFLLHQTIDQSAERFPNKIAYKTDDQAMTYAELAHKTSQLAHALIELGVRKGDRVGVHLHQGLDGMVAIYGISKAGAAFVPFDPGLPRDRIHFMLNDCGISMMITENRRLATLVEAAEGTGLTTVIGPTRSADSETIQTVGWSAVTARPESDTPTIHGLTEEDLAYIMYTSGSTGTPKGLMHTHRSGLAYARASAEYYELTPDDTFANHAPLHFDISTFGSFSCPLVGATTLVLPEEYKMLPASLSELIQDEQVTVWYSVTTALTELLIKGALEHRDLSRLRIVSYGGEVFPPAHLQALMKQWPHARFFNIYGPAEVNQCCHFEIPPLPNEFDVKPVPIGRAWRIADSLILDENDQPVQPGEVGELLIAAPTRMAGYWNRPDLTERGFYRQRRFPDAPFEKIFYRTGDLVQDRGDGELLFLGRKDRQVKVRGYRVELSEVEAALSTHAGIAEAAVYTIHDQIDGRFIEAAVIMKDGVDFDHKGLIDHTAELVPPYATPRQVIAHTSFPRTGSGKINRRQIQLTAQDLYDHEKG